VSHEITRVYRPEWIIVFFAGPGDAVDDDTGLDIVRRTVAEHFEERYRGRVHDEDHRIEYTGEGITFVATLLLRLPTMKGEFKSRVYAERFVTDKGWADTTLVTRNSPEDYALRNYSITMLPEATA
jgi:hypothetical protein